MIACKICGLASFADVLAADQAGARWGGFVFYPASPRHLDLATASTLASQADKAGLGIEKVALVVDADDGTIGEICRALNPDWLQCHGNETPDRVAAIKALTGLPVIKSIAIAQATDTKQAAAYEASADMLLFDSAPSQNQLPGGRGEGFNWGWLAGFDSPRPWLLAGGLTADNVAEAIGVTGAEAVDVSSGVESRPGVKNHAAIQKFMMAAQATQPSTAAAV